MPSGKFSQVPITRDIIEIDKEDTGVLIFDANGDGSNDIYIASGSNEFFPSSEYYQDRLYINNGNGSFQLDASALPIFKSSTSSVKAGDIDQDGDLDLFVGGRLNPLNYPFPTNSYLLINENGKFLDKTSSLSPSIRKIGMVTDAVWTDFDNDNDSDLIVVGEFMPVQFFRNDDGKLTNISNKTGVSHSSGWWNSINAGDFDNDGDVDYILGNHGLNYKYQASVDKPLNIYAKDFDKNGTTDPIISAFNDNDEFLYIPEMIFLNKYPL